MTTETKKKMTGEELKAALRQFTGTEHYYRTLFGRHTDGVQFLACEAGAFWLVDAIFSHRRREPFQVWRLAVDLEQKTCVLTMQEDTGQPELVRQEIPYTDFPMAEIELWLIDGVLILPSEY